MRAAVLEEFGQPLAVQEVDLAEPKAGEVLVRLVACDRISLDDVNHAFELMEAQDGIRSVIELA
jgi:Zn-dependent alcohol dehydrogenase